MNIIFCKKEIAEKQHIEILKRLASANGLSVSIEIFDDAEQMLFALEETAYSIDLVFLDVDISGVIGFDVVNCLRKYGFRGEVIFLTEVSNQWERAFDVHAFHYILKNTCSKERFVEVAENAIKSVIQKKQETIAFTCAGKRVVVPIRNIQYFVVINRWIYVYYDIERAKESFEFFSSLGKIEQILLKHGFIRIHRSCLVALKYISAVYYNEVILMDGTSLSIARGKYKEVKEAFIRLEGVGEKV